MLTFEGSTIGYDSQNFVQLLNQLSDQIILNTCSAIRSGLDTLRTETDQVWAGTSADRFKKKMEEDANAVITAIKQAHETFEEQLKSTGGDMIEVDNSIEV